MRFIFSRWNKFLFYERCFQVVHEQDFRDSPHFHGSCCEVGNFQWSKCAQWDCEDPSGTPVKNWFHLRRSGSFIYAVTLNAQPLQEFRDGSHLRGSIFRVIARNVLRISTKYLTRYYDWYVSNNLLFFENTFLFFFRALEALLENTFT